MDSPADATDALDAALIEEAGRKSGLLWLQLPGAPAARAAWHVWHSGAAHIVHEGQEQPLPELAGADTVLVIMRSKDKGGRLVTWPARPHPVEPGTPDWEAVVGELAGNRLNAPDGHRQPLRWAEESLVTRLEPIGPPVEKPGAYSPESHAAAPPPSPATTVGRLPFVLGRRARRR